MPVAPAIPLAGLAGLRFLERTYDRQFATFSASPDIEREVAYFMEKAADVTAVDQLVADRRLLAVALGAFGLDDDLDKRAFVRKVLEDGTLDSKAFANRLVEPAYREMSAFLGFGDVGGLLIFESTRQNLVDRYRERRFELAVGETDIDLRLAMNFRREAARIVADAGTDDNAWLRLLGSQPLRRVVETAFGLPDAFALIDIDAQVAEIRDRARGLLGSSSRESLGAPGNIERIVERFMLYAQARAGIVPGSAPGSIALDLLRAGGFGAGAQANLFDSNFV